MGRGKHDANDRSDHPVLEPAPANPSRGAQELWFACLSDEVLIDAFVHVDPISWGLVLATSESIVPNERLARLAGTAWPKINGVRAAGWFDSYLVEVARDTLRAYLTWRVTISPPR